MPANFQNCKIYKVISPSNPELVYYGHTCRTLDQRMKEHKSKSNDTASKIIIEKGDAIMELIENYPCNSRQEATRREGWHQRNNECVNHNIAGRTQQEYREDNQDRIKNQQQDYRWAKIFGFGKDVRAFNAWWDAGQPQDITPFLNVETQQLN